MKNVLFVCARNKWRSPTAEEVFLDRPDLAVDSAGLNHDAEVSLCAEQVLWADIIFVMEKSQRSKLARKFRKQLWSQKIVCLDIPDNYPFMDRDLITLLQRKVPVHLK